MAVSRASLLLLAFVTLASEVTAQSFLSADSSEYERTLMSDNETESDETPDTGATPAPATAATPAPATTATPAPAIAVTPAPPPAAKAVVTGKLGVPVGDIDAVLTNEGEKAKFVTAVKAMLVKQLTGVDADMIEVSLTAGRRLRAAAPALRKLAAGTITADYTITIPASSNLEASSIVDTIAAVTPSTIKTDLEAELATAGSSVTSIDGDVTSEQPTSATPAPATPAPATPAPATPAPATNATDTSGTNATDTSGGKSDPQGSSEGNNTAATPNTTSDENKPTDASPRKAMPGVLFAAAMVVMGCSK